MMTVAFTAFIAVFCFSLLIWACRTLTAEHWQIFATIPIRREGGGWRGLNITWYGVFTAFAFTFAAAMFLVLSGSTRAPLAATGLAATLIALVAVPATRVVARIVEGKAHTFSVAGAMFVGLMASPGVLWLVQQVLPFGSALNLVSLLAAMTTAYAFGEGLGRIACISFGCCYGRSVDSLPQRVRWVFQRMHFVFDGSMKKIAYASGMAGVRVVPVQAMVAVANVLVGLVGMTLFLQGSFWAALCVTLVGTQTVRVTSETLRADDRGSMKHFSAYQVMVLIGSAWALGWAVVMPQGAVTVSLESGLAVLAQPGVMVSLLAAYVALFLFTGRSEVTEADIQLRVCRERI